MNDVMSKGVYALIFHFIWWKYIEPNLSTWWQTNLYEVVIAQAVNNSTNTITIMERKVK